MYLDFPSCFFLLGLGVTNDSSSHVCDDNPTKENAVPNEVDGVPGVEDVDSSDWLSVSQVYGPQDSLEESSVLKGDGLDIIG